MEHRGSGSGKSSLLCETTCDSPHGIEIGYITPTQHPGHNMSLTTSTTPLATGTISINFKLVKNEAGPSTLQIISNLNATIAQDNNILRGDSAQNNNILRGDSAQNNTLVVPMCHSPNHVVTNGTTPFPLEGSDNTPLLWNLTLDEFSHDEPQTSTMPSLSADIDSFLLSSEELEQIKHMTDSEFNGLFNDTGVDADVLEVDDEQHRHTKVSPEAVAAAAAAALAAEANSGSDNKSSDDDDDSSDHSIHSSDDDDSDDDEAEAATPHPPSPREQPARTPSRKRRRECKARSRSTILAPRHLYTGGHVATTRAGCSKCRYSKRGCNAKRCIRIGPNVSPKEKKNLRFEKNFEMKHPAQKW